MSAATSGAIDSFLMETDPTEMSLSGDRHPTIAELKNPSHPSISEHLAKCSMCRSVVQADDEFGDQSVPIPLDLPKGLVSENAFKWPADPIARGGMAQIFAGQDRRLGRTVILKAPREGDDLPAGMGDMFQRRVSAEARVLAKLQHPSIVTIYELGKASVGWPFCVLEKVEGMSLRDRLDELAEREERDGKRRTHERLELLSNLTSIAEALAYAHEKRIVHRDCTPNNIILGKRGEATLIDWGIARDLSAPHSASELALLNDEPPSATGRMVTISAGTPPYLPLEQSQGRTADPSFDVYSFGITLYEVVSGKTPFEWRHAEGTERTRQLAEFLDWLKSGDPPPPADPRDPELSGIIARSMAHDPGDRFTSDELVRALKQYLTGDLVFSHRYSLTGRMARWMGRHKAITTFFASIVVLAIGGALAWGQLQRAQRQEAEARETASQAQANAAEKERDAEKAQREAEAARALADKAQREGKDADALRKEAERKESRANSARGDAEKAAKLAKGTAEDAVKRFQEAMKQKEEADTQRDLARTAQADAEKQRDQAHAAQTAAEQARTQAEKEREGAQKAREAAEKEREAAKASQAEAEKIRDAAREAQGAAEKERDAAVSSRAQVEKERDEARRKIAELEARLRDAQKPDAPPP